MLTVGQLFNPILYVTHNGVLCFNRHTDPAKPIDALPAYLCTGSEVCVPEVKLKETFQISHKGMFKAQWEM